jgi:hypothetical protein
MNRGMRIREVAGERTGHALCCVCHNHDVDNGAPNVAAVRRVDSDEEHAGGVAKLVPERNSLTSVPYSIFPL